MTWHRKDARIDGTRPPAPAVSDPDSETTDLGPLISAKQHDGVVGLIAAAVEGGGRAAATWRPDCRTPRVLLTPHAAYSSDRTAKDYLLHQAQNVVRWHLEGAPDFAVNAPNGTKTAS